MMLTIGTLDVPSLLLSACCWTSLYFILRWLDSQTKAEWHCRIVTVIHAVTITLMSAWALFAQGPSPFTDAGGPNTQLQVIVTTICLGYFLFDFSWCMYFRTEGPPMLLHHTLSIVGLTWTLCAGKYGTEMMATICGSEATNPLLQLRWFLKETGHYNTYLGGVVDLLFMTSFFTLRIGVGSVLLYCYFQQPTDFWGRLAAVCIYLIGWMFSISIFQFAVYKYGKKVRAWLSSRQLEENEETVDGTDRARPPYGAARNGVTHRSTKRASPSKTVSNGVHCKNGEPRARNGTANGSAGEGHTGSSKKKN